MDKWSMPLWLLVLGLSGQVAFSMRFIIQWICSEIKKESHVPLAFWYFSILGSVLLCTYAILRRDPVIVLGQSLGVFIYIRNLVLIYRKRAESSSIMKEA